MIFYLYKESLYEFVKYFNYSYEQEFYRLKLKRHRVIYKKESYNRLLILVLSIKSREGAYR